MKPTLLVVVAAALTASALPASAWSAPRPKTIPITHVYSPKGFDSNDNTQVILSGYLPSLCYKAPKAEFTVAGSEIHIRVTAMLSESSICPLVVVPFLEPISIGALPPGAYQVLVNEESAFPATSSIGVDQAPSPAIDEHIYANVLRVDTVPGSRNIVIRGENPSSCFVLDRIEFVSNGSDTYSVLPILKQVQAECDTVKVPFAYPAVVPSSLAGKSVLLHVRVMNGKSVNVLLEDL